MIQTDISVERKNHWCLKKFKKIKKLVLDKTRLLWLLGSFLSRATSFMFLYKFDTWWTEKVF